jgi:hypothetical protein
MGDIDSTIDEAEYGPVRDGIRASCAYGVLLCLPRPQPAAHLFANVIGLGYVGRSRDPRVRPCGVPRAALADPAPPVT